MSHGELTPDQARHRLYELMQEDLPFEEKAQRVLALGETYLDVENGHLTRIDADDDYWEAIASTDPDDGEFPAGLLLDLNTTYCRRVIEQETSIALHHADEQGWADDPAFDTHGLQCYHGTPLNVDDEPWGTVCFVSDKPRDEPFDEGDTMFAELIARMLEHELNHAQQEAKLNRRADAITVLSRVLRHNLRNDMTAIRGYLSRITDSNPDLADLSEPLERMVDDLIDLSDTARQFESVVDTDYDHYQTDLVGLTQRLVMKLHSNHPAVSFTIEGPDDLSIPVMGSFQQALEELLENAAKHTHAEDPQVTVTLDGGPERVTIRIQDNGPGLPQQEREVLKEGTERPLMHGSGLGLWLVYWIVTDHGGTIETEVSDAGTCITVTLPRVAEQPDVTDPKVLKRRFEREQDRFQAVFEQAFDGIVLFDDNGRYIDTNPRAGDLFGLSPEELIGRSVEEFLPDDYAFEAGWEAFQTTGQTTGTFPLIRADGERRTMRYAATRNIVPGQHLAILRDVTDEHLRERDLRVSAERLAQTGGWEYDPDADRVWWTDGTRRIVGVAEDYEPSVEDALSFYHPADRPAVEAALEDALTDGEPFEREVRIEPADGGDRWVRVNGEPVRENGEITALRGAVQDITERKARETHLSALRDAFPDIAFIIDEAGCHVELLASPESEELLYTDPERILGKRLHDIFPQEQAEELHRLIRETLATGEGQELEYVLDTQGGVRRLQARTMPLDRRVNGKRAVTWVARDITDR